MAKNSDSPIICETFVLGLEALPSADIDLQTADPDRLADLYRQAGFEKLAESAGPMQKAAVAQRNYPELTPEEYQLYAEYLTQIQQPKDCTIPPPETALAALIAAGESNVFNEVSVLSHPVTHESLLLGSVTIPGISTRLFKIAHWGKSLTTLESLRQMRQQKTRSQKPPRKTPALVLRLQRTLQQDPQRYGLLMGGSIAACWLLLLVGSWWLFAGVMFVVLILVNVYVYSKTHYEATARYVVSTLMTLSFAAGVVVGFMLLNNDRTSVVAVCSVTPPEKREPGDILDRWKAETSQGNFLLEPGFYDNTYYANNGRLELAARALNGQRVKLTWHYGEFSANHYVNSAQTLGAASCG